jgi:hypothetical protein
MDIIDFFIDVEKNDLQNMLTNPRAKRTKKKEYLISAWIQASKKMWHEQSRSLTEEEKNIVIQDAEKFYNREVYQHRNLHVKSKRLFLSKA